jgi:ATP-binding cassette subfamily B protein
VAEPASSMPKGLRASLRAFVTTMTFAIQADPKLVLFLFAAEVLGGAGLLFAAYSIKLLANAALDGDEDRVLVSAGFIAGGWALRLLANHVYVSNTVKVEERALVLLDRRLAFLSGRIPGIEHHERPDYANELSILADNRRYLAQVPNATVLTLGIALQLVGGSLILATLHPVLLLLPLFGVASLLLGNRGLRHIQQSFQDTAERSRQLRHLFERASKADTGKEIRLFGLSEELVRRHRNLSKEVVSELDRAEWHAAVLRITGASIVASGYVGSVAFILWLAFEGRANAGDVVLVATLASQFNLNIAIAVNTANYFFEALRQTARYLWLSDYAVEALGNTLPVAPAPVPSRLIDGVRLEHVSFRYPGTNDDVLHDVSLELKPGSVMALVGENGAGKTTLVKLLARFYDPTVGEILVDGTALRTLDPYEWQSRVATAFQDFSRFEFLARETVGVGALAAIDDAGQVETAIGRAGAEAVIPSLPRGLESQLGREWPEGVDLSGGQWQQLALARAFMRPRPLLVVFDEPTAAIDATTEHALFEHLSNAIRRGSNDGLVTLIISHRFSTVRMADLIVVLDEGSVREVGSHEELMAKGGLYAELYSLQARSYR